MYCTLQNVNVRLGESSTKKGLTQHVSNLLFGAGGGTGTHMLSPTSDFESDASAIPPRQQDTL